MALNNSIHLFLLTDLQFGWGLAGKAYFCSTQHRKGRPNFGQDVHLQDGLLTWLASRCWLVTKRGRCPSSCGLHFLTTYQLHSKGNQPQRGSRQKLYPLIGLSFGNPISLLSPYSFSQTVDKDFPALRERDIDSASCWGNGKFLEEHRGKEMWWSFREYTVCHNLTPESGFPHRKCIFNYRMIGMSSYSVIR